LDTSLTTTASPPAARSLHEICQAARRGTCGPFCGALPGDECVFTTAPASVPVTRGTAMQPARGYHVSRFAWAQSHGLISAAEFAAATGAAGPVTPAMVIYDTLQGAAISGDRRVLGPFETAAEALPALRPADGSFVAPESRPGLLTEALHDLSLVVSAGLRRWQAAPRRLDGQLLAALGVVLDAGPLAAQVGTCRCPVGYRSGSAGEGWRTASVFGGFTVGPGRTAGAGAHAPERVDDEEDRHGQVEDHGGQRQEAADHGRGGLEQHG